MYENLLCFLLSNIALINLFKSRDNHCGKKQEIKNQIFSAWDSHLPHGAFSNEEIRSSTPSPEAEVGSSPTSSESDRGCSQVISSSPEAEVRSSPTSPGSDRGFCKVICPSPEAEVRSSPPHQRLKSGHLPLTSGWGQVISHVSRGWCQVIFLVTRGWGQVISHLSRGWCQVIFLVTRGWSEVILHLKERMRSSANRPPRYWGNILS